MSGRRGRSNKPSGAKRSAAGRSPAGGGRSTGGGGRGRSSGASGGATRGGGGAASRSSGSAGAGSAQPDRSRGRRSGGAQAPRGRQSEPRGLGGDQVEGRQAVRELLLAGRRDVRELLISGDASGDDNLADIVELATQLGVTVRTVGRTQLERTARTDRPQGVVALAEPLPEVLLDDLVARSSPRAPGFLLVLDGITDPRNLGAIVRSAECAGVTGIVLPRHRAVHVTPAVTKSAAGAVEYIPMSLVGGVAAALSELRKHQVWVVGLDAAGTVPLYDLPAGDGPIALVLGAEGRGLSRLVRDRCDALVGIPMLGQLASLNVSVAAALGCFEVARQRIAGGTNPTASA